MGDPEWHCSQQQEKSNQKSAVRDVFLFLSAQ